VDLLGQWTLNDSLIHVLFVTVEKLLHWARRGHWFDAQRIREFFAKV
jgi:hypothetical protein